MQLIYLLALPLAFCHDNVTLTELSYSDCILALQYYNTDQFNLINCYKSGENGFYSTSNWGECTYRCCSPVKSYEQVRSSVDSCDDDRRSYMAWLTGIIIGSIFGGLIGIPLLIILGCFICDRWKNRVVVNSFPSIESQTSLNPLNFFERIRWNPSKRKEGYDCLVCNLGESQIELFDCKHMVHWECWKESYIKEKQCTKCRSRSLGWLRIYCSGCRSAYFTARNQDVQRLGTFPRLLCNTCKKS